MGFVISTFGLVTEVLVQVSILVLYLRLFAQFSNRIRILSYIMLVLVISIGICRIAGPIVGCSFHSMSKSTFCSHFRIFIFVHVIVMAVVDFIIWMMPIPLIWNLKKIERRRRIGVIATFSVGLISLAASAARLAVISTSPSSDVTWDRSLVGATSAIALSSGIIAACIPPLRPLLTTAGRLRWRKSVSEGPHAAAGPTTAHLDSGIGSGIAGDHGEPAESAAMKSQRSAPRKTFKQWKRTQIGVADTAGVGALDSANSPRTPKPVRALGGSGSYIWPWRHSTSSTVQDSIAEEAEGEGDVELGCLQGRHGEGTQPLGVSSLSLARSEPALAMATISMDSDGSDSSTREIHGRESTSPPQPSQTQKRRSLTLTSGNNLKRFSLSFSK